MKIQLDSVNFIKISKSMENPNPLEKCYLIGIRFDVFSEQPDFYTILYGEEDHFPIAREGYIIYVRHKEEIQQALDYFSSIKNYPQQIAPQSIELTLDFAQVFYLLNEVQVDEGAVILNTINVSTDFLSEQGIKIPEYMMADLYQLADHLTFNQSFGKQIEDGDLKLADLIEIFQWLAGAIMSKSMFFPK